MNSLSVEPAVRVQVAPPELHAGRFPEVWRIKLISETAPALSPVNQRASARSRIRSSFLMIEMGDVFDVYTLNAYWLVSPLNARGAASLMVFCTNRASGVTPSTCSCASVRKDGCATRTRPFGSYSNGLGSASPELVL